MTGTTDRTFARSLKAAMHKMPLMMSCAELELKIDDYLDADLTWRERWMFEMHLKVCRECRAYLKAYRRTIAATGALFDVPYEQLGMGEVSENLVQEVLARHWQRKDTEK